MVNRAGVGPGEAFVDRYGRSAVDTEIIYVGGSFESIVLDAAGSETRTLKNADSAGQVICLYSDSANAVTVTVESAINVAGNNTIDFTAANQYIVLMGAIPDATNGRYSWIVLAADGASLSTV